MYEGPLNLEGWALYFLSLRKSSTPPSIDSACRADIFNLFRNLPDPDLIDSVDVRNVVSSFPLKGKLVALITSAMNIYILFTHPLILFDILATIFNTTLLSGHVPSSFEHSLIVPIPKKRGSDLSNPSNFAASHFSPPSVKYFRNLS